MSEHEKIREILLKHQGKKNMITAPVIAESIGIEPGPSGVDIRELITETIITYHLPIASSSRGYYLLEDPEDLKRYQKSLDGRSNKITMRKLLVTQYFSEFYNREELELTREAFEEEDIEDMENNDKENEEN